MKRVREGKTLGHEVEDLGGGLLEAKLTYQGQEFRLFFSRQERGLLALHLINKKARRVPQVDRPRTTATGNVGASIRVNEATNACGIGF